MPGHSGSPWVATGELGGLLVLAGMVTGLWLRGVTERETAPVQHPTGGSLPRFPPGLHDQEAVEVILTQHYLACLSHASNLIGDETTGPSVVIDPRRDVGVELEEAAERACGSSG